MAMSTVPCSALSWGTSAVHSADSTMHVLVAGDDVVPVPAAVDERLERQVEDEGAGARLVGGGGVHPLRTAVGHRLVEDHRGSVALQPQGQGHVGDHGPASPVARREGVEVGAEREPLAGGDAQRGAGLDLVGVDGLARRGRLTQGGRVHLLGPAVGADLVLVGVEDGGLGVDVEREDVEVTVQRHDLPLQQLGRRTGRDCHSSTPPLCRSAPSEKCGLSLFSYIDSAEPMAMCMSRYL